MSFEREIVVNVVGKQIEPSRKSRQTERKDEKMNIGKRRTKSK